MNQLMQINKYHGPYNKSVRTGGLKAIKYICVHYTGGTGSAKNNCIYFSGGNRNASADYFIDDDGIWEYNDPMQGYYTWAVGDGGGKYGITNSNSVSIEVVNNGGPFSAKEISYLTELTQHLMMQYGVPAERVVRHYDASRKQCPYYYVDQTRWNQLHAIITNGDDDMITNEQIELIGQSVWDRGVQLSNGKWVESGKVLAGTYEEVMRTDDPSGRDVLMKDHDHIKWMAKVQAQQTEKLDAILQVLERIANKLG